MCGSLSATRRLGLPSARSASHTAPMPPRPNSEIDAVRADRVAGLRFSGRGHLAVRARQPLQHRQTRLVLRARLLSEQVAQRVLQIGGFTGQRVEPDSAL